MKEMKDFIIANLTIILQSGIYTNISDSIKSVQKIKF